MIEVVFLITLALVWIVFATVQDLRTKEVANWLNFSLIIFALGFRLFYGVFGNGFGLFYQGLIGVAVFFILGNIFYHSRVFAGGDAKLMIALGAILPLSESLRTNTIYFTFFLVVFFLVGAIYGILWSITLIFRNFKLFRKHFSKLFRKNCKSICSIMASGLIFMFFGLYAPLFLYLGILVFIFPYFILYAKALDEAAMIKRIDVKKLREGDWLYKDVKIGKRMIKASWGGLNKKNITDIRKKHKFVRIREGIAFIPVFLVSFLVFVYGILLNNGMFEGFVSFFTGLA